MNTIEEMSQGWWKPSPGSIYPLLQDLEREGLVRKVNERYELTDEARHEMEGFPWMSWGRPRSPEDMVNEMSGFVSYLEDLGRSDSSKLKNQREKLRAISDRLNALVREGGETK